MNKIQKILVPKFLRQIDAYLLQNYPIIWDTKVHFVLFYSFIVGNLALFSISFLLPISQKVLIEFDDLMRNNLTWVGLSATLALTFYGYKQTISPIKVHTIKENLVRFGVQLIILGSFLSNLFVIPLASLMHVNNLYKKEQLENDILYIKKMDILSDHIKAVYLLPESTQYINQLKKSHFNQNNEVNQIIQTLQTLEEVITLTNDENTFKKYENQFENFVKSKEIAKKDRRERKEGDYVEEEYAEESLNQEKKEFVYQQLIKEKFKNYQNLINYIEGYYNGRNTLTLQTFNSLDFRRILPTYSQVLKKYPPVYYSNKYIQHRIEKESNDEYVGIEKLKNVSNFSNLNINFSYFSENEIYESFAGILLKKDDKNERMNKYGDRQVTFSLQSFEKQNVNKKQLDFYTKNILNSQKLEKALREICAKNTMSVDNYLEGSSIIIFVLLSVSAFLSVSKFFTFRNLFVSVLGGIIGCISFFSGVWLLMKMNVIDVDKFNGFAGINIVHWSLTIFSFGFVGYLLSKKIHIKWLNTGIIFLINAMFFTLFLRFVALGNVINRRNHVFFTFDVLLMPIFLMIIFTTYLMYSQIKRLPARK